MYTVQDDLLVKVIFAKFAWGKLIGEFCIGDFVPRAIEHAQIETKMVVLYWQFLHRTMSRQYKFLANKLSCIVAGFLFHSFHSPSSKNKC